MQTLNPRQDVVFKLFFVRNHDLLISLLNAVLQPATPIESVEVLNPELDLEHARQRGVFLDVLARHSDGQRTDVEMQAQGHELYEQRMLYYWARLFAGSLKRGEDWVDLHPCHVIALLGFDTGWPDTEVHERFRVFAEPSGRLLCDMLEVHTIELRKLAGVRKVEPRQRPMLDWARFFASETDEERRRLAMTNPDMKKADDALKRLSEDPDAREAAEIRAFMAEIDRNTERRLREEQRKRDREQSRAEGRAVGLEEGRAVGLEEGRAVGLEQGRTEGQRALLKHVMVAKFGPLPADVAQRLDAASEAELARWGERVATRDTLASVLDD